MESLSQDLRTRAINEIHAALLVILGESAALGADKDSQDSLRDQASKLLQERIESIVKMNSKYEGRLAEARIKVHIEALREGHRKEMRKFLMVTPGVSKETAKEIVAEISAAE